MSLNGFRKQNLNLCENRNDLQHVQDTRTFFTHVFYARFLWYVLLSHVFMTRFIIANVFMHVFLWHVLLWLMFFMTIFENRLVYTGLLSCYPQFVKGAKVIFDIKCMFLVGNYCMIPDNIVLLNDLL